MLAGNADRERAADVLKAAFAEGRLTKDEHDYRLSRAMAARTIEELQQLTGDVPNGPMATPPLPMPYPEQPISPYWPPPPPSPRNAAAMASLVCGVGAPFTCGVTGLPAVILGHKARADMRRTGEEGDGAAAAGLALGWASIGVVLLVLLMGGISGI